jgi:hypothetical protein
MTATTHLAAMALFAAAASAVLAFQSRPTNRERLLYAVRVFVMFVGGAILAGWLLYLLSH